MNISENKRVVALSAVFALAFGGVMYYGYTESQKYADNETKITEIRDRFDGYINKDMPPTKQNLKDIKAAFSEVAATRADIDVDSRATICSEMVFHSPQAGHLPIHFEVSLPHDVQKNARLTFAIVQLIKEAYDVVGIGVYQE